MLLFYVSILYSGSILYGFCVQINLLTPFETPIRDVLTIDMSSHILAAESARWIDTLYYGTIIGKSRIKRFNVFWL